MSGSNVTEGVEPPLSATARKKNRVLIGLIYFFLIIQSFIGVSFYRMKTAEEND